MAAWVSERYTGDMPNPPPIPDNDAPFQAPFTRWPKTAGQTLRGECERYTHPRVRDIAWLLSAPDLLTLLPYQRPTLEALGLGDDITRHRWLSELEQAPEALESAVDERRHHRLGLYHELLWRFVLAHAPGSRLLAHNLRIMEGKITLGELDMLYLAAGDTTPTHLEVAIKFYLGLPQGPGPADGLERWIGPGGADSLAIKTRRSLAHQLPLALSERGQQTIRQALGLPVSDAAEATGDSAPGWLAGQCLAMPGGLFRPWQPEIPADEQLPPPRHCHPSSAAQAGWWVSVSQFAAFCQSLDSTAMDTAPLLGCLREKPAWLAPPPVQSLTGWRELQLWLEDYFAPSDGEANPPTGTPRQAPPQHPRQLWLERAPHRPLDSRHEASSQWRVFVVPDGWHHFIPLPPASPT